MEHESQIMEQQSGEQRINEIVLDEMPVVAPVVMEEKADDADLYSINSFSL